MARRKAPLQINEFSGGLNTEFNPLSMPANISTDEENMEIERDGSRRKRFGFDYEPDNVIIDSDVAYLPEAVLGHSIFRWENAGGDASKAILVIQVGNHIGFYDLDDETSITNGQIDTAELPSYTYSNSYSYAVIDGLLVVASGAKRLRLYEYTNSGNISEATDKLLIRDLFGVEANSESTILTDQDNMKIRPSTLTDKHLYNLRNQTFSTPYYQNNTEGLEDPVVAFNNDHPDNLYPSNSDNLNRYLYADPNDGDNRLIERFFSENMVTNGPSATNSPKGYFIIDALDRGTSRNAREEQLREENPDLTLIVGDGLPHDETPDGAKVIEEFGGRIWYGGFSAEVIGGDPKSPRMSSYVLFSVLVKDRTDIAQCYQRADPTSPEDSALVDTDGGFIRLDEAFNIKKMASVANSLFVFADNGVWRISGGSDNTFRATSYEVEKVTDYGAISADSVVVTNKQIFYWGGEGIYVLQQNQFGVWQVSDISQDTIQSRFLEIDEEKKRSAVGFYDLYDKKIRWLYAIPDPTSTESEEFILDMRFNSFTYNKIPAQGGGVPVIINIGESQPYKLSSTTATVTSRGIDVTASGVDVTATVSFRTSVTRTTIYLVIDSFDTTINYSLGRYRRDDFYDWGGAEGNGVAYDAFLETGAFTGGEARYRKQVPYLNVFFKKTEDGFDSNLDPTNPSSCLLRAKWNWTDSANGNKWSTPRQAYRIGRLYFPTGPADPYDSGDTVITTRNKIRGWGYSVAFRFESEAGKNLIIHGWSFDVLSNDEE